MTEVLTRYEKLLRDKKSSVEFSTPYGTVRAVIESDLTIGVTSSYDTLMDTSFQQDLSKKANLAIDVVNRFLGTKMSQVNLVTYGQTVASWIGSNKPQFSLSITLLALSSDDNPIDKVRILLRCVAPRGNIAGTMKAPTNYRVIVDRKKKKIVAVGTVSVRYSNWFVADNVLITDVQVTSSQVVNPNGIPLFVKCNVSFEPYRVLSQRELLGYLRV